VGGIREFEGREGGGRENSMAESLSLSGEIVCENDISRRRSSAFRLS